MLTLLHFDYCIQPDKEMVRAQVDPHQFKSESTSLYLKHTDAIRRSQFATCEGVLRVWAPAPPSQDEAQAAHEL
jgi:hypothetical protein